jgi:ABC-type transport system involved in cytochrome bd biosynthesis fused ATPase/permease subunit
MKITIEGLNTDEQVIAKQLLVDALREFITARDGNYVERRYASHDATFRALKAVEVVARQKLAAEMVTAVFDNLELVSDTAGEDWRDVRAARDFQRD